LSGDDDVEAILEDDGVEVAVVAAFGCAVEAAFVALAAEVLETHSGSNSARFWLL